jgi:hypothetical protein
MKKLFGYFLLFIFLYSLTNCIPIHAQTATVSATAVDGAGTVIANGGWVLEYVKPFNFRQQPLRTDTGAPFTERYSGTLDAAGAFSQADVTRTDFIAPGGGKWRLTISPLSMSGSFSTNFTVTAGAKDASAEVTAAAGNISVVTSNDIFRLVPRAYNIGELSGYALGSWFFDIIAKSPAWYDGVTWQYPLLSGSLNFDVDCSIYPGASNDAKIAACIAALPTDGGTANASKLTGTQTWVADPFIGVTKPVYLKLGQAVITTPCLAPGSNVLIEGIKGQTVVKLKDNANTCYLIQNADFIGGNQNLEIRNLELDCNRAGQVPVGPDRTGCIKTTKLANFKLENVYAHDSYHHIIQLLEGTTKVVINKNWLDTTTNGSIVLIGNGTANDYVTYVSVTDNDILNSGTANGVFTTGCNTPGIYGTGYVYIGGNRILDNKDVSVEVGDCSENVAVVGNTIRTGNQAGASGLMARSSRNVTFAGNTIEGQGQANNDCVFIWHVGGDMNILQNVNIVGNIARNCGRNAYQLNSGDEIMLGLNQATGSGSADYLVGGTVSNFREFLNSNNVIRTNSGSPIDVQSLAQFTNTTAGEPQLKVTGEPSKIWFRNHLTALPNGLWDFSLSGDVVRLRKNTAVGGDFSTNTIFVEFDAAAGVAFNSGPYEFRNSTLTIRNDPARLIYRTPGTALPNGLWDSAVSGDNYIIRKNTAVGGDFSTNLVAITIDPTAEVTTNQALFTANVKAKVNQGIVNGTGFQHERITTGVIAGGARADVTVTWDNAYSNTSYTYSCSVKDTTTAATTAGLVLERINAVATTDVHVTVFNPTGGNVTGEVHCISMHD